MAILQLGNRFAEFDQQVLKPAPLEISQGLSGEALAQQLIHLVQEDVQLLHLTGFDSLKEDCKPNGLVSQVRAADARSTLA